MIISAATDRGLVRSSNQDAFRYGTLPDGSVWACVCDGMGGANGGDVASSMAAGVIARLIENGYGSGMTGCELRELINKAAQTANLNIFTASRGDPSLFGMGTTAVIAVVRGDTVYTGHAGDSRAYRISGDRLVQLTVDHSMVQELVDSGKLTPEQAKNHPRKNIITRALGVYGAVELDYTETQFGPGDKLLLCSDGLSNYVEPERIVGLAGTSPAERLADIYIEEACANGGGDNVTAVIICE